MQKHVPAGNMSDESLDFTGLRFRSNAKGTKSKGLVEEGDEEDEDGGLRRLLPKVELKSLSLRCSEREKERGKEKEKEGEEIGKKWG